MCMNQLCTLKESCYRYNAPVNDLWQTYADFKQDEKGKCDYYWEDTQKKIKDNENLVN